MWKHPVNPEEHARIIQLHALLPIFVNGLLDEAERIRSSSLRVLSVKEKIQEFIADNFNRSISTADLARHLTLSVSRTCHLVNSCFQCPFSELLTRERIAHAKLFLSQTDYRVSEIAFMCGFSSVEHFNRMFRNKTSFAPLAYRKLFNGQ
jgi:AraC family transcriptional regulator